MSNGNLIFNFGKRLKELRESKNLNQDDIARKLNITRAAISSYETDKAVPRLEILKELCLIYNISSDYLLDLNIKGNDCILLDDDLTDEQKEMIKVMVNNLTKGLLKLNKKY